LVAKHDFTVALWVRLPVFILDLFLVVTAHNNPDVTSVRMVRISAFLFVIAIILHSGT
jgi:hypothetical protein